MHCCDKKLAHSSNTSNLSKRLKTTHPESHNDSEQKQEDAQTSKSPAPLAANKGSCRRVFREAKHIKVQVAALLVITSTVMFFFPLCLSVYAKFLNVIYSLISF